MNCTLQEIATLVRGRVVGDGSIRITGVNGVREAQPGDLAFLYDPRYAGFLAASRAAAVVVQPGVSAAGKPVIEVEKPQEAMVAVLRLVDRELQTEHGGIHPSAVLGESVQLGAGVSIGPNVVISAGTGLGPGAVIRANSYVGERCVIGPQTIVNPNVTIMARCEIGSRCIIHSGAVIGSDGFGFVRQGDEQIKVPQVGTVVIEDDVEIGANTCVDRATMGVTRIGQGTKIDNLVQIGHNVQLGRSCIVCGNAGIAGSAVLNDKVTIGAGAGIKDHIEIGAGAVVAAYSGVTKSVPPGTVVFGYPAVEYERNRRMHAALRQLPDTLRRVRELEQRLQQLEGKLHGTSADDC
jgi:UDP-3-O-[3-hydroxymyristoyl] glucosamine N-acyltransferase